MRTQSRIDDGSRTGLSRHCRLSGPRALPRYRTSRSRVGIGSPLLNRLLSLGSDTATRTGSRFLGRLVGNACLGGRVRLGCDRSRQLGQSCGLTLSSATTGTHDLSLANLRQRAGLCNFVGN